VDDAEVERVPRRTAQGPADLVETTRHAVRPATTLADNT
jgi:hypothetical protein